MNLWVLADLSSRAAIGINSHIIGKPRDGRFYGYVRELAQEIEGASRRHLYSAEIDFLLKAI